MKNSREKWLPVVDYEGRYEVSDRGRVRSIWQAGNGYSYARAVPRLLSPKNNKRSGYPEVNLSVDGVTSMECIHVLVLSAFVGPRPPGYEGCHGDGTRTNNRLSNLRCSLGASARAAQ